MATDYNHVADAYVDFLQFPIKRYPDHAGMLAGAGDVRGQRVIDVACGEGEYARQWARAGAGGVVGVDLSAEMIARAKAQEAREPLGIAYHVGDACALAALAAREQLAPFDLATAAHLLVYAETRDALDAMCRSLASVLRPGGHLVHLATTYDAPVKSGAMFAQYGMSFELHDITAERLTMTFLMPVGGRTLRVFNTVWSRATLTDALQQAGFAQVSMVGAPVGDEGLAALGEAYWAGYQSYPIFDVITATRGREIPDRSYW